MEIGKNPGLNLYSLHQMGITGKDIGIAIIDQPLLVDHEEYYDRVRLYEEINVESDELAYMHGTLVSSIALGKNVGVAPEADLYYIGCFSSENIDGEIHRTYRYRAQAVRRIIDVNRELPEDKKIRVLSMSLSYDPNIEGHDEIVEAILEARNEGIFVITTDSHEYFWLDFSGLGRDPYADPDLISSYTLSVFREQDILNNLFYRDKWVMLPIDSKTFASPSGKDMYGWGRMGGSSCACPYLAGLYALACQVRSDITPDIFQDIAFETGTPFEIEIEGIKYPLAKIFNPVKITEYLQNSLNEVDTTVPIITIKYPINNEVYYTEFDLEYSISEPATRKIYTDNNLCFKSYYNESIMDLSEGTHTIKIVATDLSGNEAIAEVSFTIDLLHGYVKIINPIENSLHYPREISLDYIFSKSASISIIIDGIANSTAIPSGTHIFFSEGDHTIEIISTELDEYENSDQVVFSVISRPIMLGDVNSDGLIDIIDALLTAQYYVGLDPENFVSHEAADVNGDGEIDIVDALLIARYYIGLIDIFPAEL